MVQEHSISAGFQDSYKCYRFHREASLSHNFDATNTYANSKIAHNDDIHEMVNDNFDFLTPMIQMMIIFLVKQWYISAIKTQCYSCGLNCLIAIA